MIRAARVSLSVLTVLLTLLGLVVPALAGPVRLADSTPAPLPSVYYRAHVQDIGWQPAVIDGRLAGTTGQGKRMEALEIDITGVKLQYRAQVQSLGWLGFVGNRQTAGTTGRGLRLEAVEIRSTDPDVSIEYRAHVQGIGWQDWVRDGAVAGTVGRGLRMEAIEIRIHPATVSFAITADSGTDTVNKNPYAGRIFTAIGAAHPDFLLHLGDLGYVAQAGIEKTFCTFVRQRIGDTPMALMPGNHEGLDPKFGGPRGQIQTYASACGTRPAGIAGTYPYQYVIDRPGVRIIMISPNISTATGKLSYGNGTAEQARLGQWIDEARRAGKFVVVAHHEPYLSPGPHRSEPANLSSPQLAEFEIAHHVDLVLSGHDHVVARSHQLTGQVRSQSTPKIVDRDGSFASGAGTVFALLGTGGHEATAIGPLNSLWKMAAGTNSPGGTTYAWGEVTVSGNKLTYTLRPVAGSATDSFTITR